MSGSRIEYHGTVLGLTAGTGSALAVLPTQNASGNWIKIVQRLPVRIGLEPGELAHHPLFLGLSANVDVDVRRESGSALSRLPVWQAGQHTGVYEDQESGASEAIHAIIAANLDSRSETLYARASGTDKP
jgi:membrane fusion protein, multidrug efflux system